jgi:oligopeptide/dipeptide ABC transporter ATP-binding protein
LLSAIPVPDPTRGRDRPVLQGDVPSPLAPPPGCRFHTRCPYAQERCRQEPPVTETDEAGHQVACHFWRTLPPADALPGAGTKRHPALAKLQAAFLDKEPAAQ